MKEIPFDLTEIFPSIDDPAIDKKIEEMNSLADNICKNHQKKIVKYDATQLLNLLVEWESYLELRNELRNYSGFSFYGNMLDEKAQKLNNKFRVNSSKNAQKLTFIRLEIGSLLEKKPKLINNKKLENYKHFLEKILSIVPYRLSENEEKLIIEKDQSGVDAWEQLRSKWASTREFEIEIDGNKEQFHLGELSKYAIHENRLVRKRAYEEVYQDIANDQELYSFAFRNIFTDWVNISKRRGFAKPKDASLISNEITEEILDNMFDIIEKNADLYKRAIKLKEKLLGIKKFAAYDFNAPIPGIKESDYSWEDGKKLIIEAFAEFDSSFQEIVKDMFNKNHIDATPRKGKTPGAFCSTWYKGKSGFILQSYNNNLGSVQTTAHELGHAIHAYLMTKKQTILNTSFPAVAAETASFFGELLLLEKLLENIKTKDEKIDLLLKLVMRIGHVIFGLTPLYWFEESIYEAIVEGSFLDGKTISNYWISSRERLFGDTVEFFENIQYSWALVPHYYMANYRFYNYPYIFAQLFVYALYQQYIKNKKEFIPKFKKALEAGGSLSPIELGEIIGLDISKPEFWELGLKQYEYFLNELEKLLE